MPLSCGDCHKNRTSNHTAERGGCPERATLITKYIASQPQNLTPRHSLEPAEASLSIISLRWSFVRGVSFKGAFLKGWRRTIWFYIFG